MKYIKVLLNKIRITIHKNWEFNYLRIEPSDKGISPIKIDESKIIGNTQKIIWMFGMIDQADNEALVYCVIEEDRAQENCQIQLKEMYIH